MVTKTYPAVQISKLLKRYGDVEAVRNIDLSIPHGSLFGLIGPDGAGKSSLMKSVAGVMSYEGGKIEVLGQPITSEAEAEKVKIKLGFMPQGLGQNLYPDLSIDENIEFFARLRLVGSKELKERRDRLLDLTRLISFRDRAMKNLSGGMKQKLGLVCTLIHEPEFIILDEPTTGVDPVSRRDFWAILAELLGEKGITALVSSAYMDEASRFDSTALMHEGSIIAQGTPQELVNLIPGISMLIRVGQQLEALQRLRDNYPQVLGMGEWLRVFAPGHTAQEAKIKVRELLHDLDLGEIIVVAPELEEVVVEQLETHHGSAGSRSAIQKAPELTRHAGSMQTTGFAIEAKDLVREFGAFRAVDGVSFQVAPGEIFGLLGANGAGKTTVIKMLTGILAPTAGNGNVAGADMHHSGREIKERIGYMSQAFSLYQDLTAEQNIRLYAGIYGVHSSDIAKRISWIMDVTSLQGHERHLAGSLPMGMRQRLALGCALIHSPGILFLDEPTSGVDPIGRRHFWDMIFQISRNEGVALLVTTHYMSEAEHCDHIALMHAGKVVADDTPEGLKRSVEERFGHLLEVETNEPYVAQRLLRNNGFEDSNLYGRLIHLLANDPVNAEQRIREVLQQNGLECTRVERQPVTMEDVFIHNVLEMERQIARQAA